MGKAKPPKAKPQEDRRDGARSGKQRRDGTDGSAERGVRKQGEQATKEQAVRVAREEKEVEERSADPAGKETERERVRESWREVVG